MGLDRTCHAHQFIFSFLPVFYPPFASIAKGEVFVLLYVFFCFLVFLFFCFLVFLFVRLTISQQPAGRFTPYFACGRSLGRDVCLLPFWGLAAPGWRKKRQMKFSLLWSQWGIFCILAVFWAISQQRVHGSTPNIICVRTMSADVPPPLVGSIGPWGGGGRGS